MKRCILITLVAAASAAAADTNSILDRAASSADFGKRLISQYESSTNGFSGDRLLAVGIAYATQARYMLAEPIYERFLKEVPRRFQWKVS